MLQLLVHARNAQKDSARRGALVNLGNSYCNQYIAMTNWTSRCQSATRPGKPSPAQRDKLDRYVGANIFRKIKFVSASLQISWGNKGAIRIPSLSFQYLR